MSIVRLREEWSGSVFGRSLTPPPKNIAMGGKNMDEKIYKVMRAAGGWNIAIGVVSIVVGIMSGVVLIVAGARLLTDKSKIIF